LSERPSSKWVSFYLDAGRKGRKTLMDERKEGKP